MVNYEEQLGLDKESIAAQRIEEEFQQRADASGVEEQIAPVHAEYQQVFTKAKEDLNFLAAIAMPTVFKYCFPALLIAAWQLLVDAAYKTRDFSQLALGIPRGFSKTTIVKLFILYCILFTQKQYILVVSSISTLAENILADVCDMLNEANIVSVFGSWKIGVEKDTQELKKFTFRGRSIILQAVGAGGSIRGTNIKNERPDVIIMEDMQTAENAESKVQYTALERWMIGTLMKAKAPDGCLFCFVGNMYPTPYSILRKLKRNPRWIKFICGGILTNGTSLWEELQPIEQLMNELENDISMGQEEIFAAEVLNDENAKIHTRADLDRLNEWPYNAAIDKPQGKFIFIDPAGRKTTGDMTTISGFDVYDEVPAITEIDEGHYSPGDTIKRTLLMCLKGGYRIVGVEATAYQESLLYWFEFIAKQLEISGIEFVPIQTGGYSKNSRITDAVKTLSAGECRVHPNVKGLVISQLAAWNPLKKDNVDGILDTIAYAPKMLALYGHMMSFEGELLQQEYQGMGVQADNCSFSNVVMH